MYLKIHETQKGRIVAACDKELVGKVLDGGKAYLDLEVHGEFYKGSLASADELKAALKKFNSANLVGKKAVGVAITLQLADKNAIMYINNTPHIQLYKMGGL